MQTVDLCHCRKEDIRIEATKGLAYQPADEKLTSKPVTSSVPVHMPDFINMVSYVKEKVWTVLAHQLAQWLESQISHTGVQCLIPK